MELLQVATMAAVPSLAGKEPVLWPSGDGGMRQDEGSMAAQLFSLQQGQPTHPAHHSPHQDHSRTGALGSSGTDLLSAAWSLDSASGGPANC